MALYWLTQALKGEKISSLFSPDGTLISASAAPHCWCGCGNRTGRTMTLTVRNEPISRVPGPQSPEQLQPVRTTRNNTPRDKSEKWPPSLAHNFERCNRTKDWWTPKKSCKIGNSGTSIINSNQIRQVSFAWTLHSNHCSVLASISVFMALFKAVTN